MPHIRYKPHKVVLTRVLNNKLMQYEKDIHNTVLNNWFNNKEVQVIY